MIRPLKSDELSLCIEGGEEFFREAKLPGKFNPDLFKSRIAKLIDSGSAQVFGIFGDDSRIRGAIAGVVFDDLYTGDRVASELWWFMLPEARGGSGAIKLLKAYEAWAREKGCQRCAMIHLLAINSVPLEAIYRRMGYNAIEVNYFKELACQAKTH